MCVRAAQGQGRELCSWPTPVCRRRWQMLLVYKARDSQCFGTSRKLSACHPLWNYKHWRVHLLYSAGHTIVTKLTTGTVSAFFVFFVCKRVQLQCTSTCPAKGFSDETYCNRETESLGVCVCVCVCFARTLVLLTTNLILRMEGLDRIRSLFGIKLYGMLTERLSSVLWCTPGVCSCSNNYSGPIDSESINFGGLHVLKHSKWVGRV